MKLDPSKLKPVHTKPLDTAKVDTGLLKRAAGIVTKRLTPPPKDMNRDTIRRDAEQRG